MGNGFNNDVGRNTFVVFLYNDSDKIILHQTEKLSINFLSRIKNKNNRKRWNTFSFVCFFESMTIAHFFDDQIC